HLCTNAQIFLFTRYGAHRELHSFPTRRSSDLGDADQRWHLRDRDDLPDLQRRPGSPVRLDADAGPGWVMRTGSICGGGSRARLADRKSTRLNSSHVKISYAVFCLKKKKE